MHKSRTCRIVAAIVSALLAAPAAQAQDQREQAVQAAVADGMTTAVGVAATAGAIHPVGALLTTAGKAYTFHRASTLPETEQPAAYAAASAMWMGSAVSNVCITAVFLTGGGFAPACLALGAAWGLKTWDDSEDERRYWERCAILRQFALRQAIPCAYVPPGQRAALVQASVEESAAHEAAEREVATQEAANRDAANPDAGNQVKGKRGSAKQRRAKKTASRQGARKPVLAAQAAPRAAAPEPATAAAPVPEPPRLFATPYEIEAP
ncbi:MAG TPA: hypothetical protein VFM98_14060 [Ramlibacter sp.]|uniref:hypothetical protein n=1 Tax=Ramlibacter sp. TaxID=1917967 RepID=UPI002D809475|nr:hypothetical protein [Ramlibacter sp.]HET8746727.1 hypothetical protein [Ramlibacter sp.]